jgi:hypothetical protein
MVTILVSWLYRLRVVGVATGNGRRYRILLIGQDWVDAPSAALLPFSARVLSTMTFWILRTLVHSFDEDTDSIKWNFYTRML